jgi:multidrug efflux pump subunit AcrB
MMHPYHAIINATISRVRPVLMASLTTIVGMIPLVTDPMYGSMALVIMGGLAMGTLVTLVLIPLFYASLFRIKKPQDE